MGGAARPRKALLCTRAEPGALLDALRLYVEEGRDPGRLAAAGAVLRPG
jgi:hypothetical protein